MRPEPKPAKLIVVCATGEEETREQALVGSPEPHRYGVPGNELGHSFEVWVLQTGPFLESCERFELVASFAYFQEALDYRDYAGARIGVPAVVRSYQCTAPGERPRCASSLGELNP